jgi:hypothetical protein
MQHPTREQRLGRLDTEHGGTILARKLVLGCALDEQREDALKRVFGDAAYNYYVAAQSGVQLAAGSTPTQPRAKRMPSSAPSTGG